MYVFMLTELNKVLDRPKQRPSQSPQRLGTSDTSSVETDTSKRCPKIPSKKTFSMEEVYGAGELGRFCETKPTALPTNPVTFFAELAKNMFRSSNMGNMNCCTIFKGLGTSPEINGCALRHGACWISLNIQQ